MKVGEIMADRNNLLAKIFKQANPNLTYEKAQKRVKEYYDTIKNKPEVEKLAREKVTYFLSRKNQHQVLTQKNQRNQIKKFFPHAKKQNLWSKMTIDDYEVRAK